VIHAVGTNLMPDMGGLRRLMPVTFATMTVGLAALAGVPPFAGFFSKEAVLGAAEEAALHEGPVASWAGWLVLVVGLATVAVTAAYVARVWLLTVVDRPRSPVAAHEAPAVMRWPLVALAVPSVLLGAIGARGALDRWISAEVWQARVPREVRVTDFPLVDLGPHLVTSLLSVALVVVGAGAVLSTWRLEPLADPTLGLRARVAMERAFYVDDVYDRLVVRPVRAATGGVAWTDDTVVGGAVRATGSEAGRLARLVSLTQAGNVQTYLTGLLAGVLLLAVGVVTLT
jgi:NADH-quinone oxidoreductase subunit L